MTDNKNSCYGCSHFTQYYIKGITHFDKAKCGWCSVLRENIGIHDGCGEYKHRPLKKRNINMLRYSLNGLLTEISEIRKVLEHEEDRSENL